MVKKTGNRGDIGKKKIQNKTREPCNDSCCKSVQRIFSIAHGQQQHSSNIRRKNLYRTETRITDR